MQLFISPELALPTELLKEAQRLAEKTKPAKKKVQCELQAISFTPQQGPWGIEFRVTAQRAAGAQTVLLSARVTLLNHPQQCVAGKLRIDMVRPNRPGLLTGIVASFDFNTAPQEVSQAAMDLMVDFFTGRGVRFNLDKSKVWLDMDVVSRKITDKC